MQYVVLAGSYKEYINFLEESSLKREDCEYADKISCILGLRKINFVYEGVYMENINKLEKYAELACDENGEYAMSLLDILCYKSSMSESLYKELINEIDKMAYFFENNFEIVKRKETFTREWEELEYKYEL